MKAFRRFAAVLAVVVLVSPSHAGMPEAFEALDRDDNQVAIQQMLSLAEAGDPEVQYYLGYTFERRLHDYRNALKWYQIAAARGHILSSVALGLLYSDGKGVERDQSRAFAMFLRGAEGGNWIGMSNLAAAYASGRGTARNPEMAFSWWSKAASQGDGGSQLMLGLAYVDGIGTPADFDEGLRWMRLAAEKNVGGALANLARFYGEGIGVPLDYYEACFWGRLAIDRITRNLRSGRLENDPPRREFLRETTEMTLGFCDLVHGEKLPLVDQRILSWNAQHPHEEEIRQQRAAFRARWGVRN